MANEKAKTKDTIKSLDKTKLFGLLSELKQERFKLRMQANSDQGTKTHRFKQIRRDIARIKTKLNEKEQTA